MTPNYIFNLLLLTYIFLMSFAVKRIENEYLHKNRTWVISWFVRGIRSVYTRK